MYLTSNINTLINLNKLGYCAFAKELSISSNTLWSLANKESYNPHLSVLIKISEYFGVSLDDLVYKDLRKKNKEMGV